MPNGDNKKTADVDRSPTPTHPLDLGSKAGAKEEDPKIQKAVKPQMTTQNPTIHQATKVTDGAKKQHKHEEAQGITRVPSPGSKTKSISGLLPSKSNMCKKAVENVKMWKLW